MPITRHRDPHVFRARVEPFLARAEAENNLLLGLLDVIDNTSLLVELADDAGAVVAAALRTPPFNLVVSDLPADTILPLVRHLDDCDVPGVVGPASAGELARALSAQRRLPLRVHHTMRVFENRRLIAARPPVDGGRLCTASAADLPLVTEWFAAFDRDVGNSAPLPAERIAARVAHGDVVLWQTSRPVAMAAISRRTPHGAAVAYVYTPPELRGRGYASACVEGLTAHIFADGRLAFLFTDVTNPTSNKIYQALGYRPIGEIAEYRFDAL